MKKSALVSLVALAMGSVGNAVVYVTDFESGVGSEWSASNTESFNSTTVLGQFDNSSVSLTLSGLTAGEVVTVTFDLYIRDSWDGNDTSYGPDHFRFLNGSTALMDTTFANTSDHRQSFPDPFGVGDYAAFYHSDDRDIQNGGTLPNGYYGNSLFNFGGSLNAGFSTMATGSTMTLTWEASGLQGVGDEGWNLDNVAVRSVPEPATVVALAMGAVAMRRRSRKR